MLIKKAPTYANRLEHERNKNTLAKFYRVRSWIASLQSRFVHVSHWAAPTSKGLVIRRVALKNTRDRSIESVSLLTPEYQSSSLKRL